MDASDFRIGNWINTPKGNEKIDKIEIDALNGYIFAAIIVIPLTPEILEKAGFIGEPWAILELPDKNKMVGDGGIFNLVAGKTASPDGLPYHMGIQQKSSVVMSLETFLEIRRDDPDITPDNCNFDITHSVFIGAIKYLHQLQNLYFALTSTELDIKL